MDGVERHTGQAVKGSLPVGAVQYGTKAQYDTADCTNAGLVQRHKWQQLVIVSFMALRTVMELTARRRASCDRYS